MKPISTDGYLDRPDRYWMEVLRSPDPLTRRLAAYALGQIGPPAAAEAAGPLAAALEDEAEFVRVWAAAALARVCPGHEGATAALLAGASDSHAFVRSLAVWHLGRLGSLAAIRDDTLSKLEQLQSDDDPSVCVEANLALARLHKEGSFQAGGR